MLGQLNDLFAANGVNIAAQYYQTDGDTGYVVIEADGVADPVAMVEAIRALPGTVRARLLRG
ncbi:MAG: phosphoglycerate dehydrogenase, partial [Alsobacter sp.]